MKTIIGAIMHKLTRKSKKTERISLYRTKRGNYYLPTDAHSDIISHSIKKGIIYDENIYNTLKEIVVPGTTVLDVGSNFGQMSRELSLLVGKSGEVHAFEAEPFVYKILKMNAAENSKNNNAANIITHLGAVHNEGGKVLFYQDTDLSEMGTYGSYGIDVKSGGIPVTSIKIDDIDFKGKISAMKVDIEGWDIFALRGAIKTINKHRMPIIFEYGTYHEQRLNTKFQDYVDFVSSINYRFEKVVDNINYLIVPKENL